MTLFPDFKTYVYIPFDEFETLKEPLQPSGLTLPLKTVVPIKSNTENN